MLIRNLLLCGTLGCSGLRGTDAADPAPTPEVATPVVPGAAAATPVPIPVPSFRDYKVDMWDSWDSPAIKSVNVNFRTIPQTTAEATAVVRYEGTSAVERFPGSHILVMAFDASGEALPDMHYGGPLAYKPGHGPLVSMDKRDGIVTTEIDRGGYFVASTRGRTVDGIEPRTYWHSVSIVFKNRPSSAVAKQAILDEISARRADKIDINTYIYVGDKLNSISWKQQHVPGDKRYMHAEYTAASDEIVPSWRWD